MGKKSVCFTEKVEGKVVEFIGRSAFFIVSRAECVFVGGWTKEGPEEGSGKIKR